MKKQNSSFAIGDAEECFTHFIKCTIDIYHADSTGYLSQRRKFFHIKTHAENMQMKISKYRRQFSNYVTRWHYSNYGNIRNQNQNLIWLLQLADNDVASVMSVLQYR